MLEFHPPLILSKGHKVKPKRPPISISFRKKDKVADQLVHERGQQKLIQMLQSYKITTVSFANCELLDVCMHGIFVVVKACPFIESLVLSFNHFSDDGFKILATELPNTKLQCLNVSNNPNVTFNGVDALTSAMQHNEINALLLMNLNIGANAARVVQNLNQSKILFLNMSDNVIGEEHSPELTQCLVNN